jgi:hypothetical protein
MYDSEFVFHTFVLPLVLGPFLSLPPIIKEKVTQISILRENTCVGYTFNAFNTILSHTVFEKLSAKFGVMATDHLQHQGLTGQQSDVRLT